MTMRKLLAVALAFGLVACTAIVSTNADQCSTTADCARRGPDFVGTMCSGGLCVVSTAVVATTTKHACNTNADCASKGAGMVCSSSFFTCAPTTSDDCKVAYGDPTVEGTVLFGLMSEIGRDDSLYFRQEENLTGAVLAFRQFFETANLQLAGNHKAALLACSEHSPNSASAFLANAGVKAIIGPADEEHQSAIVQTVLPARIPTFAPWINGNPALSLSGSDGFAWLTSFQRSDVIAPLNAVLSEKESELHAKGKKSIRVAVIVDTASAFTEYGTLSDQRLLFNGMTALDNQSNYQRFVTGEADPATTEQTATAIVNFAPDIIIPFADVDWGAQLLPALEEKFAAAARPIYIPPFLQSEDAGYAALDVADATVRARIQGIRLLRDDSFDAFARMFQSAYGPTPNLGAGRGFETALLVLLATHGALVDDPNATADKVVAALSKITDDTAGRVAWTDLAAAVGQLDAKGHVNYDGLFTAFDFDASHAAPSRWTTWCVGAGGQYTSTGRVFASGLFSGPAADCP